MKRSVFVCCAVFAILLFLIGCGTKREDQKKRVAGIVFQEDQFFRLVLFGMRTAAEKHGVELLEANSAGRPDKELQLVNTYVANNVDAIVISPLSSKASISALTRAAEKGIRVITYNTSVESDIPLSFVESDQFDLGASTGKYARSYIERKLNGRATIAILAAHSQTPEQSGMRVGGFKSEISKLPGVKIVAEQDAWLAEQAVKKAGDILTAHPGINVIWSMNEGGTVGAVMAVKNAGKAGKVAVFGTDNSEQLANFLLDDDNILQAVTGQSPFEIGSLAVDAAVSALKGEKVEKKVSLPGVLMSRDNPEEARRFKARLKELSK
jgi:ABC-type sugar transport system substrate-binding protein